MPGDLRPECRSDFHRYNFQQRKWPTTQLKSKGFAETGLSLFSPKFMTDEKESIFLVVRIFKSIRAAFQHKTFKELESSLG